MVIIMKKIKAVSCIITFTIMALIFFFSSQNSTESSGLSSGLTVKVVTLVTDVLHVDGVDVREVAAALSTYVRKTAHFVIFMLLGISSAVTFKVWFNQSKAWTFLCAVIFCMLYACSDEIHQIFVSGRACRAGDVMIDTLGAAVGIVTVFFCTLSFRRIKEGKRREKND